MIGKSVGAAPKTGGAGSFFKKLFAGKSKSGASTVNTSKNHWAQVQADNLTALKADQAFFKQAAQQNKQQLAKDIGAFRQAQKQTPAASGFARPVPAGSPAVKAQEALSKPPTSAGAGSKTGLSKDLEDRFARLKGRDPNQTQAQEWAQLEKRFAELKRPTPPNPRVAPSLARETADLNRLQAISPAVRMSPAQYQAEAKRLNALDQIAKTRQDILKDSKLSAAQRQKQLDGLRQIEKEYS
ncbi:hypothetical protein [Vampirovibrio chlorellavorus]|uniref:hypothetical protein n=1 Tax=Vampirovibrio chlorellavorus TaxID=758823 RepID=UPI0026EE403B|nr:hypothetical protein [Vampirovibrio chlorellavorus]